MKNETYSWFNFFFFQLEPTLFHFRYSTQMSLFIVLGINIHQMDPAWQLHWYLSTSTTGESRGSSGSSGSLETKDRSSRHDVNFLKLSKQRDIAKGGAMKRLR